MSLAVAEEKVKIIGGNEDLEMLKAIEESKKMINNRINNPNTKFDYDDPISIFDRNTLKPRENNKKNEQIRQIEIANPSVNLDISESQLNEIANHLKSNTKKQNENFSIAAENINISSSSIKRPEHENINIKTNELSITASNSKPKVDYKVDSNSTWKEGLNKQTNIDIAILSTQTQTDKDKNKKNIFDLAGEIGSFKFSEKSEIDENKSNQTSIPENLFNSSDVTIGNSSKKLLDQKGISNNQVLSSTINPNSNNLKENEKIKKIDVSQEEVKKEKSQKELSDLYKNNINKNSKKCLIRNGRNKA
jgi:hypothetical protein